MGAYDPEDTEFEAIRNLVSFKGDDRVLEVGTGDGRAGFKIAPYVGEVCGIDIDIEVLKVAGERLRETGLEGVHLLGADVGHSPFKDNSFDVVLCPWVLHHVEDKGLALQEIRRTLKRGGTFLSIDVSADNDYIPLKGRVRPKAPAFVKKRTRDVIDAIKDSGLEIVSIRPFHTHYLLPTVEDVHMFFEEFDIPYKELEKDFLHGFLEERKTEKGYKISESAYITLARKR